MRNGEVGCSNQPVGTSFCLPRTPSPNKIFIPRLARRHRPKNFSTRSTNGGEGVISVSVKAGMYALFVPVMLSLPSEASSTRRDPASHVSEFDYDYSRCQCSPTLEPRRTCSLSCAARALLWAARSLLSLLMLLLVPLPPPLGLREPMLEM